MQQSPTINITACTTCAENPVGSVNKWRPRKLRHPYPPVQSCPNWNTPYCQTLRTPSTNPSRLWKHPATHPSRRCCGSHVYAYNFHKKKPYNRIVLPTSSITHKYDGLINLNARKQASSTNESVQSTAICIKRALGIRLSVENFSLTHL